MYKQVGIAVLIIAPLVADFAARHTHPAEPEIAAGQLPPGAVEVQGPGPTARAPMAPNGMPFQQTPQNQQNPNLAGGIDPTPTLDPTPEGSSPPAPAAAPVAVSQPVMMAPAAAQPESAPPPMSPAIAASSDGPTTTAH